MLNPVRLESCYQEFVDHLADWIPDGMDQVDLHYLQAYNLLQNINEELNNLDLPVTHYFHVVESADKITLFNDQFVVWIVPQIVDNLSATVVLIALVESEDPKLEKAICIAGAYNSSRIVLRLLEKILAEIEDTEDLLQRLNGIS